MAASTSRAMSSTQCATTPSLHALHNTPMKLLFVRVALVPLILRFASRPAMMAAGGGVAALGLGGVGLAVAWGVQMAFMVVLGFGFFLLHNSVQTEVTELAPSARASAFSLHAFSFFMGQALGPMVYGAALPTLGAPLSFAFGAAVLAATGVSASRLLGPVPRHAVKP